MSSGISVVIITYNGAHRINNILQSLTRQSRPADEVVIVIDGSKDNTREVAEKFQEQLPLKIIETPNQGRAGARNTGAANSTYDLILYLDDDTRPFQDCLRDHWQHHQLKPGSIMVGYILEDPELFTTDIQQYRIKLYARLGWSRSFNERIPMTRDNFFLSAANMSISKDTFKKLNGFEKNLRDHEDYDMGNRALKMGIEMYYIDGVAPVFHDDLITCKSYISRQRQYLISITKVHLMRPEIYGEQLKKSAVQTPWYKTLIYFFISTNFVVKMIDSGILKYFIPEKIRYPFYDYVINGLVQVFPERKLT